MESEESDDAVVVWRYLDGLPAAVNTLVSLVKRSAPVSVPRRAWWPLLGACLMARATASVESLVAILPGRHSLDAWLIVRSLYETVVTFKWASVDPESHVVRLVHRSTENLLWAHEKVIESASLPILPEDAERLFRLARDHPHKGCPTMRGMAQAVDENLGVRDVVPDSLCSHEPEVREAAALVIALLNSYVGMYELLYRPGSSATHADSWTLLENYSDLDEESVRVRFDEPMRLSFGARAPFLPFAVAYPLYADLVVHCSSVLGWPAEDDVTEARERSHRIWPPNGDFRA